MPLLDSFPWTSPGGLGFGPPLMISTSGARWWSTKQSNAFQWPTLRVLHSQRSPRYRCQGLGPALGLSAPLLQTFASGNGAEVQRQRARLEGDVHAPEDAPGGRQGGRGCRSGSGDISLAKGSSSPTLELKLVLNMLTSKLRGPCASNPQPAF